MEVANLQFFLLTKQMVIWHERGRHQRTHCTWSYKLTGKIQRCNASSVNILFGKDDFLAGRILKLGVFWVLATRWKFEHVLPNWPSTSSNQAAELFIRPLLEDSVVLDVTPCRWVSGFGLFGRSYCFRKCLIELFGPWKMKAVRSFETSGVIYPTTRCNIVEDLNLQAVPLWEPPNVAFYLHSWLTDWLTDWLTYGDVIFALFGCHAE
jgi:hypothetical protein